MLLIWAIYGACWLFTGRIGKRTDQAGLDVSLFYHAGYSQGESCFVLSCLVFFRLVLCVDVPGFGDVVCLAMSFVLYVIEGSGRVMFSVVRRSRCLSASVFVDYGLVRDACLPQCLLTMGWFEMPVCLSICRIWVRRL